MNERLLQFIWQFQYYNKGELCCRDGNSLQILFPGNFNTNQGPDFTDARVRIGDTTWAGAVELHINTSDWLRHKHDNDTNYRNVVLHVVWEDDEAGKIITTKRKQSSVIPVLELKTRVSKLLLSRYSELMLSTAFIPCEKSILSVPDLVWKSWKDRLLAERMTRKSGIIEIGLRANKYHWEESFWWLLARNFGMPVNADGFEALAKSIPFKVLRKLKNDCEMLEALLFGQSGLLERRYRGAYPSVLKKHFQYLKQKFSLQPVHVPIHFLRMRPGNFPTIRLAQMATLLSQANHLFSGIKESGTIQDLKKMLEVHAGAYWNTHYRFGQPSVYREKPIGAFMIDSIIINSITPMLFIYGEYQKEYVFKEKAIRWLQASSPEKHCMSRGFTRLGIQSANAFDSQAFIELKTQYCDRKRCLECSIGNAILKLT
ncbi:MAG TPA: DUF2851 family protein [Chitinophagaceae bacterium]|nr:DUF2851 family protein [Chitinophagaceae bacterium]